MKKFLRFYRFSVDLFEVRVDEVNSVSAPEDSNVRHHTHAGQNESHFLPNEKRRISKNYFVTYEEILRKTYFNI
jgi:hypothetical protein